MYLKLYDRPFRAPDGQAKQRMLTVRAAQSCSYYGDYGYFDADISETPTTHGEWGATCGGPPIERLLRARRAINFADTAGLRPVKATTNRPLLEIVQQAVHCDHLTLWVSTRGTSFVLNEPYGSCSGADIKLRAVGLISILIPTALSPYCGGWSNVSEASPGTRSYLIGDERDKAEIADIAARLETAAASASAWNDATGVEVADLRLRGAATAPNRLRLP
jgi:hypothetical protein